MNIRRFPLTREVSLFVLIYLYLPVFVLIGYSFNANRTATVWTHASLDWYVRILNNPSIRAATWNSLVVAVSAATAATVIALLAALATRRAFPGRNASETVLKLPLILPEIVVAVATLILFVAVGIELGLGAMILAHTVFCIPFLYPIEGTPMFRDNFAVPANAPHPENAKIFINWMMKPENAAAVSNAIAYGNAIKSDEFLSDQWRAMDAINMPEDYSSRLVPTQDCGPAARELRDKIWTRLKG